MKIEATHLGKNSPYPRHYDKTILVAVPRFENRIKYGLEEKSLPFTGIDIWHAYEFGFLTNDGMPVVGILKIIYPSSSKYLVESKSLKLYLNSFNMERFGNNKTEGVQLLTSIIQADLETLLACPVQVFYFGHQSFDEKDDFEGYTILEELPELDHLTCSSYSEKPELLEANPVAGIIHWGTFLLRSNCKITRQPDWGSVFIALEGNNLPTPASFLRYIISLRDENHFHEEICEMIFKRLFDRFSPEKLLVTCLYTRRGGIDICPVRVTHTEWMPKLLSTCNAFSRPVFRQ